jgi:hypothetical protein
VPLTEAAAALVRAVLEERDLLIEQATDRIFFDSPDLAGKRPRIVTRMLVDRVFACSEASLLRGDDSEFDVFIDQVTGLRAENGFHVSTLLFGFRSFRFAIEAPLRALAVDDAWSAWEVIVAVDDLYMRTAPRAADLLVERQEAALRDRKTKLERQNVKLSTELRLSDETASALRAQLDTCTVAMMHLEQELNEKSAAILSACDDDRQMRDLLSRSSPKLLEQAAILREELKKTEH